MIRRPVAALGSNGPVPAKAASPAPPVGFTTTGGANLVATSWTDGNGVAHAGYVPSATAGTSGAAAASVSPAGGRVAASGLQGYVPTPSPAAGAAATSGLQGYDPKPPDPITVVQPPATPGRVAPIADNDYRVRLSPLITGNAFKEVLGAEGSSNLLSPLYNTRGMLFPYSPQITVSQDVAYTDVTPVHSNMDYLAYQRTPSVTISLTGKYTVQNQTEGIYALACIHFLRTVSKMYFGENPAAKRGTPPPILLLNGYGSYMFNNLRVVLKSHTYTYAETMDTVLVRSAGGTARLPALFDLALTVVVQQTPLAMRKVFNLDQFRTGALLREGGWI